MKLRSGKIYSMKFKCNCHKCDNLTTNCCFCSDKRPFQEYYLVSSIDRLGYYCTKKENREYHYCPSCKNTYTSKKQNNII
jgi:hypothetical protein